MSRLKLFWGYSVLFRQYRYENSDPNTIQVHSYKLYRSMVIVAFLLHIYNLSLSCSCFVYLIMFMLTCYIFGLYNKLITNVLFAFKIIMEILVLWRPWRLSRSLKLGVISTGSTRTVT